MVVIVCGSAEMTMTSYNVTYAITKNNDDGTSRGILLLEGDVSIYDHEMRVTLLPSHFSLHTRDSILVVYHPYLRWR